MAVSDLHRAKVKKDDEFYTRYDDIQDEINAYIDFDPNIFRGKTILCPCDDPEWSNFTRFFVNNFNNFGIKKLICTSYAKNSKKYKGGIQTTLFELNSPKYNPEKTDTHGKLFILTHDINNDGRIDTNDLEWEYLDGDGDFRSKEVEKLRDEADIIITNPPFSLFKPFLKWVLSGNKKFLIISNKNAVTNKDTFPLLMENKIWIGKRNINSDFWFIVPEEHDFEKDVDGVKLKHINGCWITNMDHCKRHESMSLMTMADNKRFSVHNSREKDWRYWKDAYTKYDNYDAIEVPFVDAIPSDYDGIMGVPITFLGSYNPDQFTIIGATQRGCHDALQDTKKYDDYWEVKPNGDKTGSSGNKTNENAVVFSNDGIGNYFQNSEGRIVQSRYSRLFIRRKQ